MDDLEHLFISSCAPTLAGFKTAGLFCCHTQLPALLHRLEGWNERLQQSGVQVRLLGQCPLEGRYMLYAYRPELLQRDLHTPGVAAYLARTGYPETDSLHRLLDHLSTRLVTEKDFPHEIGLFLGYPLHDVEGFVRHKGQNYCASGYWKVYENREHALAAFALYRSCTYHYQQQFSSGNSLEDLAVAV